MIELISETSILLHTSIFMLWPAIFITIGKLIENEIFANFQRALFLN
jgi:hypothetical protein